jgi:hypothetical protein
LTLPQMRELERAACESSRSLRTQEVGGLPHFCP